MGIYVVDDDSRSLGIPAYVVPQGTGHQSYGDVGAGGGGVDEGSGIGGDGVRLSGVLLPTGHSELLLVDGQGDGGAILGRGDTAGGGVPGDIPLGEAQGVKGLHHGQERTAVLQQGGGVGKGDGLPIDQDGEIPLLGRGGGQAERQKKGAGAQGGAERAV